MNSNIIDSIGTSHLLLMDERNNGMSFACFLKNKNGIVLCSDSRETFLDGTFNEYRQKVFISKDRIPYCTTGIIKYNNIDYVKKVVNIMNKDATLIARLNEIAQMMCHVTSQQMNLEHKRFDMFSIYDNRLYVLSVSNGQLIDDSIINIPVDIQTMGKQIELSQYFSKADYENDTIEILLSKGRFLVEKAYQLESLEKIPTINNNVQWVTINNQQEIKTNIY